MNARIAANYLVYLTCCAFDDITNMKLNKLLYFAQGYFLREYGTTMFPDKIEAWAHGPVVADVYAAYKKYGNDPIHVYDEEQASLVPKNARTILYDVARKYGRYTASTLRNMTHVVGSPWSQVYRGGHSHIEIPTETIRAYFLKMDTLDMPEPQFQESDFIGYRDKDGFLVLPKEWDDGEI